MKRLLLLCLALATWVQAQPTTPAALAWQELREGNQRFVDGPRTLRHQSKSWRDQLSQAQHPKAIILGCADSRVPPELLFDQGFGDLFVVRIAGNVVDLNVAASLDYALHHTGAHLIVVLGHEDCGAVTAALQEHSHEDLVVRYLLKQIIPALGSVPSQAPMPERVRAGVYANVRQSLSEIEAMPSCKEALASGELLVVGGVYSLHSGAVDWLEKEGTKQ